MDNMQWNRDFGGHYVNDRDFLLLSIVAITIIGLFFREAILYVIIGLFLIYIIINYVYDRSIGKKLYMQSKRQTIRLFQGEQEKLSFQLENHARLPLINGQFRFQIESILKSLDGEALSDQTLHAFQKSFSIKAKGQTVTEFPFEAKERGVAKIRNISYTIPHLFNFSFVTLSYMPYYSSEVIVFPEPLQVKGIEKAFQLAPGNHKINLSPFEEVQSPISTRDYEYSDPFYQINWKASAKTQQLQTNVFEKVVDMSYLFIVNVRSQQDGIQINEEMEKILSYTTYICNQAMDDEVPYELYINARTASAIPYLHLPEGEGRTHYIRSLEMLARIPRYTMTYPFNQMTHRVRKQVTSPKTIVIIGHIPKNVIPLLTEWSKLQKDIFHVVPYDGGAVLERWNARIENGMDVKLHA